MGFVPKASLDDGDSVLNHRFNLHKDLDDMQTSMEISFHGINGEASNGGERMGKPLENLT
jgi:hypothetical protein